MKRTKPDASLVPSTADCETVFGDEYDLPFLLIILFESIFSPNPSHEHNTHKSTNITALRTTAVVRAHDG